MTDQSTRPGGTGGLIDRNQPLEMICPLNNLVIEHPGFRFFRGSLNCHALITWPCYAHNFNHSKKGRRTGDRIACIALINS